MCIFLIIFWETKLAEKPMYINKFTILLSGLIVLNVFLLKINVIATNCKSKKAKVLSNEKNFVTTNGFCSLKLTINLCWIDKGNCEETHASVKTSDIIRRSG